MAPKGLLRRGFILLAGAASLAALAAGCSSQEEATPEACLVGSDAYLRALETAPGAVRLGGTAISDCLIPSQGTGELTEVGQQLVIVATTLNGQARKDPSGPAALRLGYLLGAASKGADSIHADLVRRLNSAASFSPDQLQPTEFQRDFSRGFAAGQESG